MCGIGAIWRPGGQASHSDLQRLMGAMPHRGPEGSGYAVMDCGALQLGFLSLAFTEDPAVGMQPLIDPERKLALLFNGEIYDHAALREQLRAKGHRFHTRSDSEVLLRLYAEYGLDLFRHLNGEFAFAIWDGRKRELICVRDRAGVKPLFYAWQGGRFALGSEIGALLSLPGMPRALDPAYFAGPGLGMPNLAQTPFLGIHSVRPGHVLRVAAERMHEHPYWTPNRRNRWTGSYDEAVEALDHTLTRAVTRRLGGDVKIALSLSSGVDSATIAALSRRTGRTLPAFGISFPGKPYDESADAARTAKALSLPFHPVVCTPESLADGFLPTLRSTAWPQPMLSSISRRALMHAIRDAGFKAVASGEGSDELFGGYPYFRMEQLWRALSAGDERAREQLKHFRTQEQLSKNVHWLDAIPEVRPTDPLPYASTHVHGAQRRQGWIRKMLSPEAAREIGPESLMETLQRELAPLGDRTDLDPFDGARWLARATFAGLIVPTLGDRIEMSASLEGRSPFTDYEVQKLAWRLPESFCLEPGTLVQKRILRDLARPLLRDDFAPPPKHTHLSPTIRDLSRTAVGKDLVADLLSPRAVREAGLLNPSSVKWLRRAWAVLPSATPRFRVIDAGVGFALGWQGLHHVYVANAPDVQPIDFEICKTPQEAPHAIAH